jgi:hypothetical protein
MKPLAPLILLTLACLAASCKEQRNCPVIAGTTAATTPAQGYCLPASSMWAEEEYTQWMTRAELQYFQDQARADQYLAHIEGRNNGGLNEYRAVRKSLPTEQYVKCAAFWGVGDADFFDCELRLLRSGFVRKSMQVFIDASGNARHQLVWLRPVGASAVADDGTPPDPAPAPAPAPPAAPVAADSAPSPALPKPPTAATFVPVEENPPAAVVVPATEPLGDSDTEPANPKKFTSYTVVKGDIMEKIARRQHTTVEAIKAANNLTSDGLNIGQKLKIPKK